MPHDIFISYPSANKSIADAICNNLESKHIRCWIAPRDILPGQNYAEALYDAIDKSKIFILVFSENTNNSPHIMSEVQRAFNNNCIIIPFRIEDILPSTALQYYIGTAHWLDAITPPLEEKIEKLSDTVTIFLKIKTDPPKPPELPKPRDKPTAISNKTFIFIFFFIIGIILIAVFMLPFLFQGLSSQSNGGPTINPTMVTATSTVKPVVTSTAVPDVSGSWTGKISDMDTTLDITQNGKNVQGKFKLTYPTNRLYYVDFFVTGSIENDELSIKYLSFKEGKPVSGFTVQNCNDINFWFDLKKSTPETLIGKWACSSYAMSGTIVLTKKI